MLGKFDSFRDSALHFLCTQDWGNDSFGDVTDYGVYIWRISLDAMEVSQTNTEFNSVIELLVESEGFPFTQELRDSLVGHFMVSENEQGLVTVKQYTLESELIRHFEQMRDHYDEFMTEQEVTPVQCQWFARCENDATGARNHPVLGDVPICDRCNDKVNRIDGQ
jgi:hypothetical protein